MRRLEEQRLQRLTLRNVVHRHLLKTPSTPVMPIPSTMSLDNLKGTVSGVGRILPCSKATPTHTEENKETGFNCEEVQRGREEFLRLSDVPKSMCTSSAVCSSIRMFWMCLSPRPTMYPTVGTKRRSQGGTQWVRYDKYDYKYVK